MGDRIEGTENDWRVSESLKREALPEPNIPPIQHGDPRMNILIGIPMERQMLQEAFFGFAKILQQGWPLGELPYTRNDIARHKMCKFLMDGPYTHLLMLDSDHVHPPNIVQRLARWFLAYPDEVEVVGGLNFRRGEPYDPCAFVDPGDGQFHRMASWVPGALRVDALGSGSMMIAKTALAKLPEAEGWFDYDYPDHSGWPGTDMTFSRKCREHGINLWVDTTTVSPHIGTQMIDENTYRAWVGARMAGQTARDALEVQLR